jgi:hypothetical protein
MSNVVENDSSVNGLPTENDSFSAGDLREQALADGVPMNFGQARRFLDLLDPDAESFIFEWRKNGEAPDPPPRLRSPIGDLPHAVRGHGPGRRGSI